ncbi:hypothetical protein GIB67_003784 [Kingdonia uniflora]|uniref:Uncharacterized protein n=1 Tax=Kingdonia uniflora TaxID=39325 RepID=A0A7J7M1F5_9MAGN|nr:hypothetical protein GIB67_003784 [Kingdonia uniflora]
MGRAPCCENHGQKKGPWSKDEDDLLVEFIKQNGCLGWRNLPKLAGDHEEHFKCLVLPVKIGGSKWAAIASHFPGRTDNEIKNLWNTHLRKRLPCMGLETLNPSIQAPTLHSSGFIATSSAPPSTRHMAQWETARLEAEARLSMQSGLSNFNEQLSEKPEPDYFLRMWNSEVGESFRNLGGQVKMECHSPISQKSTLTKEEVKQELIEYRPVAEEDKQEVIVYSPVAEEDKQEVIEYSPVAVSGSDSSCCSLDVSLEIPLQLLLGFESSEEMSFFHSPAF